VQDIAPISPEERRAAEERVVARYEAKLMRTMEIPPERRDTYEPIWPLEDGRIRMTEAFQGIFVEEVRIERSYPDTVFVLVFRYFLRPECRYAIQWQIWHLSDLLEPEPSFNDVFVVNLGEWLAKDFKYKRYDCKPGETICVRQGTPWSELLPRIASGELDLGPENRDLAERAIARLSLSSPDA
jgi:hypothetical protein